MNFTRALLNGTLFAVIGLSQLGMAADYACHSKFNKNLFFDLYVEAKKATLATENNNCVAQWDPTYRPTPKYEGYHRFKSNAANFESCKELVSEISEKGNTFDSIKVSPELLEGEDKGAITLVIDTGDFHGQLSNEKMECEKL